jgi:hypothetical protein
MAAYSRLQQRLREYCGLGKGRVARDKKLLPEAPNLCMKPANFSRILSG